jgi:hypothetical protein
MGDWTTIEACRNKAEGLDAANSRGITITAGGTANTKGTWTALATSTVQACDCLTVITQRSGTAGVDFLIDIGVGTAGSEVVVASNIISTGPGSGGSVFGVDCVLPINIPAASRLSARCQATTLSAQTRVICLTAELGGVASAERGVCTTYGTNTADSGATSIDPGGTANTKGAWTQITSSLTHAASALVLGFGNQINTARTDCTWLVDVGVGTAGSEVVVIADMLLQAAASTDALSPSFSPPFPISIPGGTAVSVRAQCSITDATDRLFDVALYAAG